MDAARTRSTKIFLRDLIIILLAAILIAFLVKTFLFRSFYIPSGSMESTLLVNDRVIVNELEPRLVPISRGDVVVFRDPGGWLAASETLDNHLVKRVIGLPGDRVSCCGEFGALRVNDVPLDEPYIAVADGFGDAAPSSFDVTVPDGMLWVMGDNRYHSEDSLAHYRRGDPGGGFVPSSSVVGRAVAISWPIGRWSLLDNYPVTFRGADG